MHRKRRLHEGDTDGPREAKLRCVRIERPITNSLALQQPMHEVLASLNNLRNDTILCDWVMKTSDNVEMPVHSVVLALSSSYFQRLLRDFWKDGLKKRTIDVNLPAIVMQAIIDFIYTGKFTVGLNEDNFPHILIAANEYHFHEIVQECYQFIMNELRPENCLSIYQFTKEYFREELSSNLLMYICHHFREVLLKNSDILELTVEEMITILSTDELNVADEMSLFHFVVRWIEQDISDREQHTLNLFKCLRFSLMGMTFVTSTVMINPLVLRHCPVQECITGFLNIVNPNHRMEKQRYTNDILFVFGGWTSHFEHSNSFIEVFDKCASKWYPEKHISSPTSKQYQSHGACALFNLVYIIGGCSEHDFWTTTNRVMCFDPVHKTWDEKACMHDSRSNLCVVALGGLIYAIGGVNRLSKLGNVERYNPRTNQWTRIASINDARAEASAAAYNGRVYVSGGVNNDDEVLQSVEVYDPLTDQWTFIHPLLSPRYGHSLVSYEGALFAIGGSDGTGHSDTVERYEQHWVYVSSMTASRKDFAAVVLDGKIYAIGGSDNLNWTFELLGGFPLESTECYDSVSGVWTQGPPLYQQRSGMVACVISGLKNAKEYSYLAYCTREEEEAMKMDQDVNVCKCTLCVSVMNVNDGAV